MHARCLCLAAILAASLIPWSPPAAASDEGLSLDEAKRAVSALIDAVREDIDCKIGAVSVKALPRSKPSARRYFVQYRAAGDRCDEAAEVLAESGRPKGLTFWWARQIEDSEDPPTEPNLDLINEVNPPLDR